MWSHSLWIFPKIESYEFYHFAQGCQTKSGAIFVLHGRGDAYPSKANKTIIYLHYIAVKFCRLLTLKEQYMVAYSKIMTSPQMETKLQRDKRSDDQPSELRE